MPIKINSSLTENTREINNLGLVSWDGNDLNKVLSRCVTFASGLAPNPLYDYQIAPMRRMFKSILTNDGANLTLLFARQSGKSETVAVFIASVMILAPLLSQMYPDKFPYFNRGIMLGFFAPIAEQAATTHARVEMVLSQDKTNSILVDPDLRAKKKYDEGVIEILGGARRVNGVQEYDWKSFVRFQTAAKQAKIESKSYHFVVVDEAQEVDDFKLTKSILPMLAAYNGTSVYVGTPSTQICEFYNAIQRNRVSDINKDDLNKDHYEYDYTVASRYNARYKQFIKNTIAREGSDTDSFQMSYALKWLIDKGMALTTQDFTNYMAKTTISIERSPSDGHQYVAGLDLGKDSDSSILTILRVTKIKENAPIMKRIALWVKLKGKTWEEQISELLIWAESFDITSLSVDATGKGDPVTERISIALKNTSCIVTPVNFNVSSKHELATDFYEELYKGTLEVPASPETKRTKEYQEFYSQWVMAVKTWRGNHMQLEHPQDVVGAKDDYVDSLLLSIHASKRAYIPTARQEFNTLYSPSNIKAEEMYQRIYNNHKIRVNELFSR